MQIVLSIIILITLLVMGVPVALCFGGATLFLVIALDYSPLFLVPYGYSSIASVTLWCIPLFIIAGNIIKKGRIGDALVNFVDMFIGKVKSGLGMVTVITCGIFGAIAGNGSATMSAIGSIMVPKLKEKGYPRGISASLIASASVLGLLIPPSSAQIVYAWASNQSVLACFLATVIPGIILAVLLCIVQAFMVRKVKMNPLNEQNDPVEIAMPTRRRVMRRTGNAIPALLMPVIILGGIYGGFMTPMESAAIATLYCIPVAIFFYKGMRFRDLGDCLVESGKASGNVAVMLMTAMLFSRILTMEKVPDAMVNMITGITTNKYLILFLVNVLLFVVGMLMEDGCGIMLCTPLLLPVVEAVGVSPIQFAAIMGVNLGMGLITPPTAPLLYFASQVGEAPIGEMLKPTMKFILFAWLPTTFLTTYIPALSLTLPRLIMGINV